jgi:hypothetical protein
MPETKFEDALRRIGRWAIESIKRSSATKRFAAMV